MTTQCKSRAKYQSSNRQDTLVGDVAKKIVLLGKVKAALNIGNLPKTDYTRLEPEGYRITVVGDV